MLLTPQTKFHSSPVYSVWGRDLRDGYLKPWASQTRSICISTEVGEKMCCFCNLDGPNLRHKFQYGKTSCKRNRPDRQTNMSHFYFCKNSPIITEISQLRSKWCAQWNNDTNIPQQMRYQQCDTTEEKKEKGQGKLDRRFKMFITITACHQLLSVRQRTATQIQAWLPLTKPPYLTCPPVPLTRPSSTRRLLWLHL